MYITRLYGLYVDIQIATKHIQWYLPLSRSRPACQATALTKLTVPGQDITLSFLLEIVCHWTEKDWEKVGWSGTDESTSLDGRFWRIEMGWIWKSGHELAQNEVRDELRSGIMEQQPAWHFMARLGSRGWFQHLSRRMQESIRNIDGWKWTVRNDDVQQECVLDKAMARRIPSWPTTEAVRVPHEDDSWWTTQASRGKRSEIAE